MSLRTLSVLLLLSVPALAQDEGMLRPMSLAEASALSARLSRTLLPEHSSHLEVQPKQVFRLVASGHPDLLLVPVRFLHGETSPMSENMLVERSRCGLFILPADATPQSYVSTIIDPDLAVSQCGDLLAVRRTPHDGPRPHLRLTYRTFDPPRAEDTVNVDLRWNAKTATYTLAGPPTD
jgi:hypothetical protein